MSAPRTPSKPSLARIPSLGSSFTSCFGASTPISPQRTGRHGLLGGQVSVNYRKLGFHEDEDEDTYSAYEEEEEAEERHGHASRLRREGPFRVQQGKHVTAREEATNGMQYFSGGEEKQERARRGAGKKLGTQWAATQKARMAVYNATESPKVEEQCESEQEEDGQGRERGGIQRLAKLWSMRDREGNGNGNATEGPKKQERQEGAGEEGVYVRERRGGMKLGKLRVMREKGRREEMEDGGRESPRRESLTRKVREACVQVIESARRSSPHVSELFVGNQILMQVASSSVNARRAKNVAPSTGFLVAGDSPLHVLSPPRSSNSS